MWDVATGQCKHSMQVNMIIRDLSYRLGLLMTDVGVFDLSFASNKNRKTSQMLVTAAPSTITDELAGEMEKEAVSNNSHFGFNFDSTWITFKGQYLLSLPSEYRPSAHAIFQDTVAIGCASGQVIIIEFDADLCP
ncbi:unnamed protein product [Penicillium salamii]|uniref:Uncharacterized protein n=1 Tax=Penicillium salamii TaxID=1612424 RepID=A0A9W4NI73_9EURO|nr:unnamed protein product [Penicillium salamii]